MCCGIVGVMGDFSKGDRRAFQEMLYVNTLRGFDSTGIVSATPHTSDWIKNAISAPDFLGMANVQRMIDGNSRMLLGHNRAATKGKVVTVNAHPFEHENIVGVHNGTLTYRIGLDDYETFDVDSDNLFYHLQRNGLQDTIDNCTGAFALVWLDTEEKSMNFYRNSQRPMSYTYSVDRKTMYWASEAGMLDWILERNHLAHQDILSLPVDTLLKVPLSVYGKVLEPHLTKVVPTPPKVKVTPVTQIRDRYLPVKKLDTSSGNSLTQLELDGYDNVSEFYGRGEIVEFTLDIVIFNGEGQKFYAGLTDDGYDVKVRVAAQQADYLKDMVGKGKLFSGVISYDPAEILRVSPHGIVEIIEAKTYYGYNGRGYSHDEYKKLCDNGCAWCSSPAAVDDTDVLWFSKEEHLCASCQQEEDVKQYISSVH